MFNNDGFVLEISLNADGIIYEMPKFNGNINMITDY